MKDEQDWKAELEFINDEVQRIIFQTLWIKKIDVWVSMAVMTKSYIDLNSNLKHTPQYGQSKSE